MEPPPQGVEVREMGAMGRGPVREGRSAAEVTPGRVSGREVDRSLARARLRALGAVLLGLAWEVSRGR
jgi:hypothetical protein